MRGKGLILIATAALFAATASRPVAPSPDSARGTPPDDRSVAGGEELVYEVSWWLVKLGTVRLRVVGGGGPAGEAKVRADVDSYPELPFVSLHATSICEMDTDGYASTGRSLTDTGNGWRLIGHLHDRDLDRPIIERGVASTRDGEGLRVDEVDTLHLEGRFQDGMSIFYFARSRLFSESDVTVPTVVGGKAGRTVFRYPGERGAEEIAKLDYKVDVVGFKGVAEFTGLYGLTGEFEGWFSNDEARVPIRATMELRVGAVTVELIEWRREGWSPPKAKDD